MATVFSDMKGALTMEFMQQETLKAADGLALLPHALA
jgi:hypothetical protein